MFDSEALPCPDCGCTWVPEKSPAQLCPACRRRKGRIAQRVHPPRCDCGQPAVIIIEVQVGEEGCYTIHMPLCEDCYRLEQEQ